MIPKKIGFVSTEDIIIELDSLPGRIASLPRSSTNTRSIELRLLALDKIDDAKCVILNDGTLKFDISPMTPVARVFDRTGESYYVKFDRQTYCRRSAVSSGCPDCIR